MQALPRPPRGPGDAEEDEELPVGDPPDTDPTDDPNDEDEGEGDEIPLQSGGRCGPASAGRCLVDPVGLHRAAHATRIRVPSSELNCILAAGRR